MAIRELTTEEINKVVLATDSKVMAVFHVAAKSYNQEILQEILDWP